MKKITVLILMLTMLMSLCACNGGEDKPYESSTATDITDRELQELIEQAEKAQTEQVG